MRENRPTFVSGGVQAGRIPNATGEFGGLYTAVSGGDGAPEKGVVARIGGLNFSAGNGASLYLGTVRDKIDLSLSLPTGPDNAPSTLATRFFRRVA